MESVNQDTKYILTYSASLVAHGKESTCNAEIWVRSLGQEDPLEEGMVAHSSLLAWRIPRTEQPGGLQSMGVAKGQTQLSTHMYIQSRTLAILDYSLIHSSVNSSCITNYLGNVYLLKQSHSKQPGVGTSTRKWGWESTIQSITRCKSTAM